jgi:seryl-tRNA synthetase
MRCIARGRRALTTAYSANLDFRQLGADVPAVQRNVEARRASGDAAEVWRLHGAVREAKSAVETVRAERNELSKRGKKSKGKVDEAVIEAGRRLKVSLASAEALLRTAEAELDAAARQIPNSTHAATPLGDETNAVVRYEVERGAARVASPRDHVELCDMLGLADFEGGARTSGSKFNFLRGAGVWLEMALTQWSMRRLAEAHGFAPMACPDLVRSDLVEGCGFAPRDDAEASSQIYRIDGSPLSLSATAEIALAGLQAGTTHAAEELPRRLAGVSHCFRTEAGARGSEARGLYRVHQFTKVEMFVVAAPEDSESVFEELVAIQRALCVAACARARVRVLSRVWSARSRVPPAHPPLVRLRPPRPLPGTMSSSCRTVSSRCRPKSSVPQRTAKWIRRRGCQAAAAATGRTARFARRRTARTTRAGGSASE